MPLRKSEEINIGVPVALVTISIWASTYISTKILVRSFSPLEISLVRFTIGLTVMTIMAPPWKLKIRGGIDELRIAAAGVLGIFLYYFLENLAAEYTYASNISIIVTTIPLWTSLIGPLVDRREKFSLNHLWAFLVAMAGMILLVFGGRSGSGFEGVSPAGDLAALGASLVFALYTVVLRSINSGIPPMQVTRKSLTWGWAVIVLLSLVTGNIPKPAAVLARENIGHFIFLGLLPSAACFVSWAVAVRRLGAVRASQFIYLVPFITVTLSAMILKEPVTPIRLVGLCCIVGGVVLSQLPSAAAGTEINPP